MSEFDNSSNAESTQVDATSSQETAANTGAGQPATQETSASSISTSDGIDAVTATQPNAGTQAEAPVSEASSPVTPEAFAELKKRFDGSTKSWQQEQSRAKQLEQELQQLREQIKPFQGIDQAQFQQFQQSQGVPMWDSSHKQHNEFLELRRTAEHYHRLIANAGTPETKDWLFEQMREQLGEDGLKTLQNWKKDVQRQNYELQTNPREFYRKLIQSETKPVIQNHLQTVSQTYQETEAAKQQAASWMKDNPVATAENIQSVMKLMDGGMKFEQATLQVERDHWKSQIGRANDAKSSAEEKERLLQGRTASTVVRNPQTDKRVDFVKYKTEKNLTPRQSIDALFELDAAKRL